MFDKFGSQSLRKSGLCRPSSDAMKTHPVVTRSQSLRKSGLCRHEDAQPGME